MSSASSGQTREAGQDLLLAGPVFREKCGSPYYMAIIPTAFTRHAQ